MPILKLFWSFFQIGLFSIGGASSCTGRSTAHCTPIMAAIWANSAQPRPEKCWQCSRRYPACWLESLSEYRAKRLASPVRRLPASAGIGQLLKNVAYPRQNRRHSHPFCKKYYSNFLSPEQETIC